MPRVTPVFGLPQPAFCAASSSAARWRGCSGEQRAAQLERILLRLARNLVEEALGGEGGVGRADRAPPLHRHADLRGVQLDREVRDGVGQVGGALHRGAVDAVLHHHRFEGRAGQDRLADDDVLPGNEVALRVEARLERVVVHRPVEAGAHVVLASPDQLYRRGAVGGLGDGDGLEHEVGLGIGAPAEAAAGVELVDADLRRRQTQETSPPPPGRQSGTARRSRSRNRRRRASRRSSSAPCWRARGTETRRRLRESSPRLSAPRRRRRPCARSSRASSQGSCTHS